MGQAARRKKHGLIRSKESEANEALIKKQEKILAKFPTIKGTVIEHKDGNALVRMGDGAEKWFSMNNDRDKELFAMGATIEVKKYPLPQDRDDLFERIELFYPTAQYTLSFLDWVEENNGKRGMVFLPGQLLNITKGLGVFCSPESTFPGQGSKGKKGFAIVEKDGFTSYEYTLKDVEAAFRHIEKALHGIRQAE